MTRDEAQGAFVQMLLQKVRQDPYPSITQMNLIEESIPAPMIPDYLAVLANLLEQHLHERPLRFVSRHRR